MRPALALSILLFAGLAWLPPAAHAQKVHRCEGMDGKPVYTDKRCEDVGAMDALPRATIAPEGNTGGGTLRSACPRTLSDLVYRITSAIDNRDVNRLAGVYEWAGVSDATANRILDRLETLVERPLLDIEPIRTAPPPIVDDDGHVVDANEDGYYPQTTAPSRAIALKVMQTSKNGSTMASTTFALRRSYGCFWISL